MPKLWSSKDNADWKERQIFAESPGEIALTATCIYMSAEPARAFLICNPSPQTWNSWMFPYGSEKLPSPPDIDFIGCTLAETEQIVHQIISKRPNSLRERLTKVDDMAGAEANTPKKMFETVYECKESKTSGVNTLYVFDYFRALTHVQFAPNAGGRWLPACSEQDAQEAIKALADETQMRVESNVFSALSSLFASSCIQ